MLLTVGSAGLAGHGCNGVVTEVGPVYIDDRDFVSGDGLWIYLESNGVAGLQSGGAAAIDAVGQATGLFSSTDPCVHANPDTLIF